MNVWQIKTGERGRDYRELFFEHDIMILGPDSLGKVEDRDYLIGNANSMYRQVHNFAHKPKPGDRILMNFAKEVIGVGEIPSGVDGEYIFDPKFSCVYGWGLSHCRRVIWASGYDLNELRNVFKGMKQQPAFTQVWQDKIVKIVRNIDSSFFKRKPKKYLDTVDASPLSMEDLTEELFRSGINGNNIGEIVKALRQAKSLCEWYDHKQNRDSRDRRIRPTEHEVVSHMVLPVFLGLGWSHQQIAIEWNKIDMAFYKMTPTTPENCVMILEAKWLGSPLGGAPIEQAKSYIIKNKLCNVRRIIITDGENLFVYSKKHKEWNETPEGYLNLRKLRKQYVLPSNIDVIKTLVNLQPAML